MAHSPIRVALLCDGGSGWPAGGPAAARFGEATLLARLLALAGEFDARPLVCGTPPPPDSLPRGAWLPSPDARDPWAAVAAALAAAGSPLIAVGLELPLVPRVWLDYLRRLAVVHWPGGRRPEGAAWGFVPRTGAGWEPRAGLFHPDLAAALAGGWRPSQVEAAGGAASGSASEPFCRALPPAEWREVAGPAGLDACGGPDELAAVLARSGEAGEAAGMQERCRAGKGRGATGCGSLDVARTAGRVVVGGGPEEGEPSGLVEVGGEPVTPRQATAAGAIVLAPRAFARLLAGEPPWENALAAAQRAAVQAVDRTAEALPLRRPVPVDAVEVAWWPDAARCRLEVSVTVRAAARAGVEMAALHGAAVFLLAVRGLTPGSDREQVITDLRLLAQGGGCHGDDERRAGEAAPGAEGKEPA